MVNSRRTIARAITRAITRGGRRSRRARSRRGVTVFVVLLVISMLAAVGVFAARSAQLGVSNAGRYREMMQTHYIAEGGMQGAISEFSRDPSGYLVKLRNSPALSATASTGEFPCQDIPFAAASVTGFKPCSTVCLRLGLGAVEAAAQRRASNSAFTVYNTKSTDAAVGSLPGSFGMADVAGNFSVEFTDERPVEPPPAGMPIAGGTGISLKFRSVTARAVGQVVPTDADGSGAAVATTAAAAVDAAKYTISVETIRAEILVGPVP